MIGDRAFEYRWRSGHGPRGHCSTSPDGTIGKEAKGGGYVGVENCLWLWFGRGQSLKDYQ